MGSQNSTTRVDPSLILIDSDILIDVSRDVPEAVESLQRIIDEDEPAIIFKLSEPISDLALDLLRRFRLTHGLLLPDSLIAASALIHEVPFVSKNTKHFRFIEELTLLPYPF